MHEFNTGTVNQAEVFIDRQNYSPSVVSCCWPIIITIEEVHLLCPSWLWPLRTACAPLNFGSLMTQEECIYGKTRADNIRYKQRNTETNNVHFIQQQH